MNDRMGGGRGRWWKNGNGKDETATTTMTINAVM